MKIQNKQILAMLYAFDQKEVLKAFNLYKNGIKDQFQQTKDELKVEGWSPQKEKPEGKEFYFFADMYWVQSEEMRIKNIAKKLADRRNSKVKKSKKYTGQKMDLKIVDILCPICKAAMYKQSVCPGCKEGKQGNKIRLICGNDPDHEILL